MKEGDVTGIEELSETQIETIARNYRLVSLIENGKSPREALEYLREEYPNIPTSTRWAQKLHKRFREHGTKGILDQRFQNKPTIVMTAEIKRLTLSWWFARPAAPVAAIWKKVKRDCEDKNLKAPGYHAVLEFINSLPEADKLIRSGKIEEWNQQGRATVRMVLTSYSNERWQIDHSRLDIWIRQWVEDHWEVVQVWISVVLDAHSRSIAGFFLSVKQPDSYTTLILLRQAISPKSNPAWGNRGLPAILQPDRGKDFMSHTVASSLGSLHISLDPDPPYYPRRKGRIERWFRTLNDGCLKMQPGHMDAIGTTQGAAQKHTAVLLTRKQLMREIESWVVTDYHQRVHSETGRKPAELWEETVRLRMPESEDAMRVFLLKSDTVRTITKTGISFMNGKGGGNYWSPDIDFHWKRQAKVRYNPEDLQSVLLYDATTGAYLCEAWLMGQPDSKYTSDDVIRSGGEHRKGLIDRQREYAAEIHEHDRRMANKAEWEVARKQVDSEPAVVAPDPDDTDMEEVERLLEKYKRRDGGRD
ncbi:MAG: Mu transposase C-terminal domain-containing protein [Pyrinomonadaceae bacterium]